MNWNKHNLEIGETVQLDKDFRNTSQVIIKEFTPNYMFSLVYSPKDIDYVWQVMTNRLTPIKEYE